MGDHNNWSSNERQSPDTHEQKKEKRIQQVGEGVVNPGPLGPATYVFKVKVQQVTPNSKKANGVNREHKR